MTVTVQVPTAKAAALLQTMWVAPAAAVTDPPQPLTMLGVAATTRFAGRASSKLPLIATTFPFVIEKVMVLGVLTFTGVGANAFVIEGGWRTMMSAVTVCWSIVASAWPMPPTPPAL